ncbi:MAG: SH3 domain-containing protein [Devosia sp.]
MLPALSVRILAMVLLLALGASAARADYVTGLNPRGDNFLALRTGPGTSYRIVRHMGPDTVVTVLQRRGDWLRVRLEEGTEGWAFGEYIAEGFPPGYDTGSEGEKEFGDDELVPVDQEPSPEDEIADDATGRWSAYANDRFGTTIEFPADVFKMLPPPDNDDGRSFAAREGDGGFIVFGSHNVFEMTLAELMEDDIAGGGYDTVTYRRNGEDWYALSGYRGGDVFYRKVMLADDGAVLHTFEITYPRALKSTFDPIAARMATSMRTGGEMQPAATPEAPRETLDEEEPEQALDEQPAEQAVAVPPEVVVAADSWRAPVDEILFAGEPTDRFLPHQAHGGIFDAHARYDDGALVVNVPEGNAWGKVGLLSNDPLVWLDNFHDDAEVRVTFTLDPKRTTGFGMALAEPGWGGVAGNDPGYPGVRFYWIRERDGASARAELHADPHPTDDFWKGTLPAEAPAEVAFVLTPGLVGIEVDGVRIAERPWKAAGDGVGLRIYVFSHPTEAHVPVKMALRGIRVTHSYPTIAAVSGPAPGVEPLPTVVLFDGSPNPAFEPGATAGGDFEAFARYEDGALVVEVPEGHGWGKTGLISVEPLVVLDERARETAVRLALKVDPARTSTFVLALSGDKAVEMWPSHQVWFTFAKLEDEDAYQLQIHAGPYNDRVRKFPAAWFDAYWDGRIEYDIAGDFGCVRIPDGPALCARVPVSVGNRLYATILAHAPAQGAATSLTLKEVTRGLVTPPGLTANRRWFFVDDDAFDPDQFLNELGSLLQ